MKATIWEFFRRCRSKLPLDLVTLNDWIGRILQPAQAAIEATLQRRHLPEDRSPFLKIVRDGETHVALNVSTGALFSVEPDVAAVLEKLATDSWQPAIQEHTKIVEELNAAGMLTTRPAPMRNANPHITTLFLDAGAGITHRCFTCSPAPAPRRRPLAPNPDAWRLQRMRLALFAKSIG